MALAGLAGFLLLAGLVDVAPQVRVHAFADTQTRIVEDPALFEGNVRARHVGHRLAFRVGDEAAHPHGFLGAAFDLPIFVLAQARGPPHVTEPVDGSNRRGNEVVHRDVHSPFPWWYSLLVALVYHVSAPRERLVATTDTLAYCLSGNVTEEC